MLCPPPHHRSSLPLRPQRVDALTLETWLEGRVKEALASRCVELRGGSGMAWDESLEHLLMPALEAYEHVRAGKGGRAPSSALRLMYCSWRLLIWCLRRTSTCFVLCPKRCGLTTAIFACPAGGRGLPNGAPAGKRRVPDGAPSHAPCMHSGAIFVCCGVLVAPVGAGGGRCGVHMHACTRYACTFQATPRLHHTPRIACDRHQNQQWCAGEGAGRR